MLTLKCQKKDNEEIQFIVVDAVVQLWKKMLKKKGEKKEGKGSRELSG